MRTVALVSLFVFVTIAANNSTVSAEALGLLQLDSQNNNQAEEVVLESLSAAEAEPTVKPAKPKAKEYRVAENDSLSTIAKRHNTTWKRLFDKNKTIEHPDIIKVGDKLTIPRSDEKLKNRPVSEPVQENGATAIATTRAVVPVRASTRVSSPARRHTTSTPVQSAVQTRGSSSGNLYTPGYCTWYVKNRRPDLPNNLGNADTWVYRARTQGLPTGSRARAGAVGQQGMHVVYVERVNSDGTVTISEMNFRGLYVRSTRTVPASNFMYIY